ncbi:MAG: PolC-type DNA polymerase III [Acutalibacteraceae bacterium]
MKKQLNCFADSFVALDIETTGLSAYKNEIIEFAAVKVENGVIVDTFSSLIKPDARIPYFITNLTGISNEDVANAPRIVDVLPKIRDFIGDSIVLGHNVTFDIGFLRANFDKYMALPFNNRYLDTMIISRRLFPEMPHHRLCDLEKKFGLRNERAHRALSDVYLTLDAYEYMKNYEKGEKAYADESC